MNDATLPPQAREHHYLTHDITVNIRHARVYVPMQTSTVTSAMVRYALLTRPPGVWPTVRDPCRRHRPWVVLPKCFIEDFEAEPHRLVMTERFLQSSHFATITQVGKFVLGSNSDVLKTNGDVLGTNGDAPGCQTTTFLETNGTACISSG